ncbi:hypothetical protein I3843_03G062700 [Carya illinoinensis]|nr:hypothetical protein I3843_03G062700 [Carya illinoinensis]
MEATKLLSFPTLHCRPFPSTSPRHRRRRRSLWGRLVDENMIALRLRIREMKISETNYEPPLNWMEWEKQYFLRCNEDISEALGLLQNYLMNTRPGLAFGMVALVFFSVLISSGVAFIHAMEIAKRILSIWV